MLEVCRIRQVRQVEIGEVEESATCQPRRLRCVLIGPFLLYDRTFFTFHFFASFFIKTSLLLLYCSSLLSVSLFCSICWSLLYCQKDALAEISSLSTNSPLADLSFTSSITTDTLSAQADKAKANLFISAIRWNQRWSSRLLIVRYSA